MDTLTSERSHFPPEYQRIIQVKDYTAEYFSNPSLPSDYEDDGLTITNLPLSELPQEEIFLADSPIHYFKIAFDRRQRPWLVRDLTDFMKETPEIMTRCAFSYEVARKVNVLMAESRLVYINGKPHNASRFLPNAADTSIKNFPLSFRKKVGKDIASAWALNYLLMAFGDLQYLVTPNGHGVIIDYHPSEFVHDNFLPPLEPGVRRSGLFSMDVEQQRSGIHEFNTYVYNGHVIDQEGYLSLRATVLKITELPDAFFNEIIKRYLPRQNRHNNVPNYHQAVLDTLKWRRDHIREVFYDIVDCYE